MAKSPKEQEMNDDEVDYSTLGLQAEQEQDREKIGVTKKSLEPIRIVRVRFDTKTKYYDKKLNTGTPIVKIDGINMEGEEVKLRSLSEVLYKNMLDLIDVVSTEEEEDEQEKGIVWTRFTPRIKIAGFELVKTEKGKNPYVRIRQSPL